MQTILLKTPSMEGQIHVGADVFEKRLPALTAGQKNFVVTDSNVYALYADWLNEYFKDTEIFVLPAGEESKNFQSLHAILQKMSETGLHRTSRLFAVGGGVVGDIAGLAAALYMRGISCVQIPTTLLAQVDSSVGGKTAVDLGGVKNLVGAFYQPCEVLVSPEFLRTLPAREIKCGLGEIVKYAALNAEIFERIENRTDKLDNLEFLSSLIFQCIQHKAQVVQADERENGERKSLNVGHTTGHAIELVSQLSHGESVLWGMKIETKIALAQGVCEKSYGENLLAMIEKALQVSPMSTVDFSCVDEMAKRAKSDKKNTDDNQIYMAVAKTKGEWAMLALSEENYRKNLQEFTR